MELGAGYVRRLERLVLRLAAARERREGAGRARRLGMGEEFVGYRPYRAGEDIRRLDWDLFARLDRPYVRVTRREAAEHWTVWLDASASMGVGPPGKLQAAAELAGALCALGLRFGARLELLATGSKGPRRVVLRRKRDLSRLLAFLNATRAAGNAGLGSLVGATRPAGSVGRLFLLGDLLDLAPPALSSLLAPGRELALCAVLGTHEVAPPREGTVAWVDPEGGGRREVALTDEVVSAYEGRLEARLDTWRRFASRHGAPLRIHTAGEEFEVGLQDLLQRG